MRSVLFILAVLVILIFADRHLTRTEYDTIQETYILPSNKILLYLLFYTFGVLIFNYPPETLSTMGITTETIFSGYLGNQDPDIVNYHCKRVVLNRGLVAIYPFIFFLVLTFLEDTAIVFTFSPSRSLHTLADISVLLMIAGFSWMIFHHLTYFYYIRPAHLGNQNMRELNRQIALEMMDLTSFKYQISSSSRLVITHSWVIFSSKFNFQIVRLEEISICVIKSEEITINHLNPEGAVQLLSIRMTVPKICGSDILVKMHNITFQDMRTTINARVEIPPNIVMIVSTIDRFSKIFAEEAGKNPPFYVEHEEDLDPCLACSEKKADMKISRRCPDEVREEGSLRCGTCNCRPMWCIQCMARVFAAKQNQNESFMWITGKAPCPTCRAVFCIDDVSLVKVRER